MIDSILATYAGVLGCLFLSVVAFVVDVLVFPFRGFVAVYSAGYLIYSDSLFDPVLQDVEDLRPDDYNLVRSQATMASFRVTLDG